MFNVNSFMYKNCVMFSWRISGKIYFPFFKESKIIIDELFTILGKIIDKNILCVILPLR